LPFAVRRLYSVHHKQCYYTEGIYDGKEIVIILPVFPKVPEFTGKNTCCRDKEHQQEDIKFNTKEDFAHSAFKQAGQIDHNKQDQHINQVAYLQ